MKAHLLKRRKRRKYGEIRWNKMKGDFEKSFRRWNVINWDEMAVEKPMTLAISLFPLILHGGPCLRMSFHTSVDGSCKWPLVQNCRVETSWTEVDWYPIWKTIHTNFQLASICKLHTIQADSNYIYYITFKFFSFAITRKLKGNQRFESHQKAMEFADQ